MGTKPPTLVTKLLERLAPRPYGYALAGVLIGQYRQGRPAAWYWRHVILTLVVCLAKDRTLRAVAILGWLLVLLLMIVSVTRHPSSLGSGLFIMDITLLSGYGIFLTWGWRQQRADVMDALCVGGQTSIALGLVLIASHAIEWFALDGNRTAQFARGAGSTLLVLGLLGAAGSVAWDRTRSVKLGVIAGLWCGSLAAPILLSFASTLNLAFEAHSTAWLHDAFVTSGMNDPGAFVVRNSLEAASEILIRMPIAAVVLSFVGSVSNGWIMLRSRSFSVIAAWIMPVVFVAGVIALWYAGSLERAARPPFVMAGVLAAGFSVCGAHPIWSSLARRRRELPSAT